ncbi:hypothetical protein ACB094_08G111200 [Castanea mollissima]
MAIAGLHNVSVLDSPFLRDSHSQASGRQADEARVRTRASSLLQMWRELEDEHVVSRTHQERMVQQRSDVLISDLSREQISDSDEHSGGWEDMSVSESVCGTWPQTQIGSHNEHVDSGNFNCEHSSDFGEIERERVRQIFREWMNSGAREQAPNVSHMSNSPRAEWLGETEQERVRIIREWAQMNSQQRVASDDNREDQSADIGTQIEQIRDRLLVNQNGGRNEHSRRGIRRLCGRQALLDMLKKAERERLSELQDLLEHRAVSQFAHRNRIQSLLRGRFLRNDRLVDNERPASRAESELGLLRQRPSVSGLREGFCSRLDTSVWSQVSSNHSDTSSNCDTNVNRNDQTQANNAQDVLDELNEQFDPNNALSENDVFIESRDGTGQSLNRSSQEIVASEWSETLLTETGESYLMQEAVEEITRHSEPIIEERSIPDLPDHVYNMDINWEEAAAQVEQWPEQVMETDHRVSQQDNMEYSEWRDVIREDVDGNQLGSTSTHQELGNEDMEQPHLQEAPEVWDDDNGFQEAVQHWLDGPSDQGADPVQVVDTYYFPEDDNEHNVEIRELLNRRRVSNLLHSGFRESLDQLIQSYLQRREDNAPTDWELPGTSPSHESEEQDLEHQSGDQNDSQRDAVESPSLALPSSPPPPPPSQPLYYPETHHDNWPQHDMHQRLGIEWDIINDMRIDMARLQQRMNNMQRMLEACMDMQLELQRSIRQEVSAALNRPSDILGACRDGLLKDESKWDYVRKGICCVCCESNINSLLYRCGHMCTCTKCANELVQSRGKCPMCWAPVVEMIRAYSIS